MTKDNWNWLAVVGLAVSSCVSTSGDVVPKEQAARQTFRYGPYLLDLQQNFERYVPPYHNQIVNCSGKKFVCLNAGSSFGTSVMNIVLPKRCTRPKIGDTWSHANQSTRVLGKRLTANRIGNGEERGQGESYLLATVGHENVVFEYQPSKGLTVIYKANVGENIVEQAKRDPLHFPVLNNGLLFGRGPVSKSGLIFERTAGSAAFGACQRRR